MNPITLVELRRGQTCRRGRLVCKAVHRLTSGGRAKADRVALSITDANEQQSGECANGRENQVLLLSRSQIEIVDFRWNPEGLGAVPRFDGSSQSRGKQKPADADERQSPTQAAEPCSALEHLLTWNIKRSCCGRISSNHRPPAMNARCRFVGN
jgi:hypothetical protein